jgi:hypothetical protein
MQAKVKKGEKVWSSVIKPENFLSKWSTDLLECTCTELVSVADCVLLHSSVKQCAGNKR